MSFSLEWSKEHKHKSGKIGRDTIIRGPTGRAEVSEVKGESFKTEIEEVKLPEGTVEIEKDITGRVIRARMRIEE